MIHLDAAKPADIERAAEFLLAGKLVAVPTETVYGLAALADNIPALESIFRVKGRPLLDPLIVHVESISSAKGLSHWNASAQALADAFWPGPLTLVLPSYGKVPALATAGLPTIALRQPSHPALVALLTRLGRSLAAPSANPFGYISPTCAQHVEDLRAPEVVAVLDGGPCTHGIESTIVNLASKRPTILRPGPITASRIASILGETPAPPPTAGGPIQAPGTLPRHYSPRKPLRLFPPGEMPPGNTHEAVVFLQRPAQPQPGHYWLSESGDPAEARRALYALLRQLDSQTSPTSIAVEDPSSLPGEEWLALADRLRRAAFRE